MEIALKSIKHSAFASQETHCYEANLYIDGKKIGQVSNDGHGGCDMFYGDNEAAMKVEAYLKEHGATSTFHDGSPMYETLESRCCNLVNKFLQDKEIKKILRRVSYIREGGLYQLPAKHKPTPEYLRELNSAWAGKDYIMVSGKDVEEARADLATINFFGEL